MHVSNKKKYEVSGPAYYDPLIAKQKRHVRQNPKDVQAWLELGRLHEAKIDMTNYFAKRNFLIRHFLPMYVLLISGGIVTLSISISSLPRLSWQSVGLIFIVIIVAVVFSTRLWLLRCPASGSKYFKKAIGLGPDCGEAYMHLGLIALRRYKKHKGCRLLEQAIRLGINNNRVERELKSLYEKEFVAFFNQRTDREIRQQETIDSQQEEIRNLHSVVASLQGRTESLCARADQAKWDANHKTKSLAKEMKDRIAGIRQGYEEQIANLRQSKESQEQGKELAERDFVRLTTEIMEAKAELAGPSVAEAARTVEGILGSRLWKTLSEHTRLYIATAEHIYAMFNEREEKADYSLVGMELCKALETEINRSLVQPFVEHLNGNKQDFLKLNHIGEKNGKPLYFNYLARTIDREHYPEVTSLTLGQYHFLLKRTLQGEYALKDYGSFLDKVCSASKPIIGKSFLKRLETVTKRYRNAIAHRSPMNKKEYHHLRELIFAGRKALLKTCCSVLMKGL